jgi:hypothetical protein
MQRHREAFVVVPALPRGECLVGRIEILAAIASPEFFVIDAMAAFDLAVLLRASRPDIAHPHAEVLTGEREEQRELGAVVPCQEVVTARQALL